MALLWVLSPRAWSDAKAHYRQGRSSCNDKECWGLPKKLGIPETVRKPVLGWNSARSANSSLNETRKLPVE
jgi:hypothetical protein